MVSVIQSGAKFNLRASGFCSHSTTCSDMFKMLLMHQQGGHCARPRLPVFASFYVKPDQISAWVFSFLAASEVSTVDEDRDGRACPKCDL